VTGIPAPGVFKFVIDQSSSEVKYVVREKLSRLPVSSDAVGTTNQITGELFLNSQGLIAGQKSSFSVDLRTLKTDESLRDNFVRQNVLQTGRFPMAEFVAESITGFPANYVEGQEASMTLKGTLTIHGVSKPVEWAVKARRSGGSLTGIADIDFKMSEYGITPPQVPSAKSEDGVHLQITIKATQSS
jgi:polyisoprenoid-binding protein YceI